MSDNCASCGHPQALHEMTHGYKPYGHCNYQHDLCSCTEYVEGGALMPDLTEEQRAFAQQMAVVNHRLIELNEMTLPLDVTLKLQAVVDAWEKLLQMRFVQDGVQGGTD